MDSTSVFLDVRKYITHLGHFATLKTVSEQPLYICCSSSRYIAKVCIKLWKCELLFLLQAVFL